MDSVNPYVAPISSGSPPKKFGNQAESQPGADLDFGSIIKRWEKLRIIYNVVLIPWTILCLFFSTGSPAIIVLIPFAGLLANLLYLLGPAIESYMTWFGYWHKSMSYVLFAAGLAFSGALAAGAILNLV